MMKTLFAAAAAAAAAECMCVCVCVCLFVWIKPELNTLCQYQLTDWTKYFNYRYF